MLHCGAREGRDSHQQREWVVGHVAGGREESTARNQPLEDTHQVVDAGIPPHHRIRAKRVQADDSKQHTDREQTYHLLPVGQPDLKVEADQIGHIHRQTHQYHVPEDGQ